MAILNYLKKMLKKRPKQPPVEYIEESSRRVDVQEQVPENHLRDLAHDIDLSPQQDLEDYARGLSVTKESIERWISSGLLMPEEMKVAEKLIKIMRKG